MKINKLTLLFFLLFLNHFLFSQNEKRTKFTAIEFDFHRGFYYDHRKSVEFYLEHLPYSFEFKLIRQTDGSKAWHRYYRFPETGFGLYHGYPGNENILGNATGIYIYGNFYLIQRNIFSLRTNVSFGFSWLSKKFEPYENYLNTTIGTNLNVFINFTLNSKLKIYKNYYLTNGLNFTHFSNGAIKKPNIGINLVTFHTGIAYQFNNIEINDKKHDFQKKYESHLIFSHGIKEVLPASEELYYCSSLSYDWGKVFNPKHKWGIGSDLIYDQSLKYWILRQEDAKFKPINYFRMGIHASFEFRFGKFIGTVGKGIYLYNQYKPDPMFYHRLGFRYEIIKNIPISVCIKSHWAKADFIEWGIGYYWRK